MDYSKLSKEELIRKIEALNKKVVVNNDKEISDLIEKYKDLELITNHSPSNIIKIDKRHIILFNNFLKTQEQKDMVLGKDIYTFILPEYHKLVRGKINSVFKKKENVTYELEGITPTTGKKSWYISYVSPVIENDIVTGAIISTFNNEVAKELQKKSNADEEKFKRLFSTANDAIFIMDNETFIDCNEQTLKMFDCKRDEIIGQPPYEFSPEYQPDGRESFEKAKEKITNAINGKPQKFYWKHITKKGSLFDAEVSLNNFHLEGKIFIQAIVRDVSEKVKAEKLLKASEEKFKLIADNAPVLIRMTDINNESYFFSTQFIDFLGKKDIKKIKWTSLIHIDERKLVIATHNQAFKNKLKFEISYRIKNNKNEYRWVLETGIPHYNDKNEFIGFITASTDITGRKVVEEALKKEETLRKSNELFRNTLEKISLIAVSLDLKGNITFCNNKFTKVVKYKKRDLLNKNWFDLFFLGHEKEKRRKAFIDMLKNNSTPLNYTSKIYSSQKKELTLSWHNIVIKNEENKIVGITSIGEDITKNNEDRLIKEIYNNINNYSIQPSSIKEFYKNSHQELNKLFEAKNLYISIYKREVGKITFPYFIDETHTITEDLEPVDYKNSLSEFVIKSNKTQVLNKIDFSKLDKIYKINFKGKIPEQWVGIPLKTKKNIFGILVVQDYNNKNAFSKSDIEILTFISNQIANAIERIQNEKLLQSSESQFRNIFENLQDLYYRTDLKGNIILMSPSIEKFTGKKPSFFIGKNISTFYSDPNLREKMIEELLKVGYINNFETDIITPSGEQLTIQANIKLYHDINGNPIGVEGMVRDITEMIIAQNNIKNSEEKFRGIFNSLQDIYYKASIDGVIEIISPSIKSISGYSPEEVIGQDLRIFFTNKNDIKLFNNLIHKKIKIKNHEIQLKKKDGSNANTLINIQFISDKKNKLIAFEGVIKDISDLKQTEEDIKLFENIIQNNWDAIVFSDLSGNIKYINQAANRLYNYMEDELVGMNVDVFNSHLTHNTDDIVNSIQNYGGWVGELKQKRKDGQVFDALLSVQLILNKKGEPIGMASHSKDISEHKKEERELLDAKNLAESSLKVKEQFLANMSHELRTPMNGIIGITELLKDTPLQEEQNEFVNIIQKSSTNLLYILNDILDLSKIEAGKIDFSPKPTSLQDILEKISSLFEYQIRRKNLRFKYTIDKTIPNIINIDELRIIQILSNLVSNAVKFTIEGSITINVNHFKKEKNGDIQLIFEVIDTGIGIEKSELGKLFNYFSQIDNALHKEYVGTGLGLAISKELTILMGGEIGIQSAPNKGSTFWFTIKTKEAKIKKEKINKIKSNKNIGKLNVLVVDDNSVNLKVAQKLIEKIGGNVMVSNSGRNSLTLLEENKFDIIFMDIQMPDMNGIETLAKIRNKNYNTPVIAMTAYAMKTDKNKFISLGFDDYVAKPINGKVIREIINKWFNYTSSFSIIDDNDSLSKLVDLGGQDFLNEILNEYNKETSQLLKEIKKILAKKDYEGASNIFHTLKGSSSTLGIINIADECKKGEIACHTKNIKKINTIVACIEKLFDKFIIDCKINV